MQFSGGVRNSLTAFDFKLPSTLYRGTMPYGIDRDPSIVQEMKAKRIAFIVLLCDTEECQLATNVDLKNFYERKGFEVIHFPIPDFNAPKVEDLPPLIDQMYELLSTNTNKNLLVHCKGGMGRTGMIIACLARKVFNYSPEEATTWVRRTLPGAIEVQSQLNAIKNFIPTCVALPPAPSSAPQLQQNTQQVSLAPKAAPEVQQNIHQVSLAPKAEQKRRGNPFTTLLELIICCKKTEKSNTAQEVV